MPRGEARTKDARFRCTPAEKRELVRRAKAAGMPTLSDYVRHRLDLPLERTGQ